MQRLQTLCSCQFVQIASHHTLFLSFKCPMIIIIVGVITIVIILPEKLNTLKNKEQIPACDHVNAGSARSS